MANYRSAMGKTVDMASLMARNENTRAVGNMNVNARGDTIDANGNIIQPVTAKVNKAYANTVGSRSAHAQRPARAPTTQQAKPDPIQKPVKEELTAAELELEESFEDDIEVEQIKAQETKKK